MNEPLAYENGWIANKDLFYSSACARSIYQDYVRYVLTRVNTYTGVAYRDDPTILAWELANEPRCENASRCGRGDLLYQWAGEMSRFVKGLDSRHMVALGDEGLLNDATSTDIRVRLEMPVHLEVRFHLPQEVKL